MNFITKTFVEDTKREEILSFSDSILKKHAEGLYFNLQVNENASVFTEMDEDFYLIENRFTIKGRKKIDNRKVYRIKRNELSSLILEYMDSYYGDRLDWVIVPNQLSLDKILYFNGSIQLLFERENIDLDQYKTEWISGILGNRSLSLKNLEESLLEIGSSFRIISNSSTHTRIQSIIQKKSGTVISTWLEKKHRKELISLSCI